MKQTPEITMKLGEAGQHARLSDFAVACDAMRLCIKHVGRCIVNAEEADCEITDLREGSAVITMVPILSGESNGKAAEVSKVFADTVLSLQEGRELDRRLDYQALRAFHGLCRPLSRSPISVAGTKLTSAYEGHLRALIESDSTALGSASGKLEALSVHKKPRFIIYPPIEGEEIKCDFKREDLPKVMAAVDRVVTVYGTLHYAKSKAFPVRVDVYEFEVHPPNDSLPTLLDVRIESPETSDDVLKALRDEWQ